MKTTIGIRTLAYRSLSGNKQRTLLTILTVALSVALMLVVLTYFHSNEERQKQAAINEIGAYHVRYDDLTAEQLAALGREKRIKTLYRFDTPEQLTVEEMDKRQVSLAISHMEGINQGLITLKEGRSPAGPDEIALDGWLLEELGLPPKTDQQLTLHLMVASAPATPHLFTVVGVIDDIAIRKSVRAGLLFVSESFLQQVSPQARIGAFALFASDYESTRQAEEVGKAVGLGADQISVNEAYAHAYETTPGTLLQAAAIILLIALTAAIVIYNVFTIYVAEKIRFIGVLKAIGATRGQVRLLIRLEGLFLAGLGSLIGVGLGMLLSLVSVPFLGQVANSASGSLTIQFSPWIGIGCFAAGVLITLAATGAPGRTAARISEIDAIRFNPAALYGKKRKGAKSPQGLGKPVNGARASRNSLTLSDLIRVNLFRDRKRTVLTILSITLTGLIFIIAASVLFSMNIGNMAAMMVQGDYQLKVMERQVEQPERSDDPLSPELLRQIGGFAGVTGLLTEKYETLRYDREDAERHISPERLRSADTRLNVYGYNERLLDTAIAALPPGTITRAEMAAGNFLIAVGDGEYSTYAPGDKIRVTAFGDDQQETEMIIAGVIPDYITYKGSVSDGGAFIAHEQLFERLGYDPRVKQLTVTVEKEQSEQVEHQLRTLAAESEFRLTFASFKDTYAEFNGMKQMIELAAYAFIAILLAISLFNLANSLLTGMFARSREIAMLEAMGQTRQQLKRQLTGEALALVGVSLAVVYAIGLPVGYAIVKVFQRQATYAQYELPLLPMGVLAVLYGGTAVFIAWVVLGKLQGKHLVQRMNGVA
jgi:ABC-type antimicrobial peptide transport system permease subunit